MKIYLATSWKNEQQPEVLRALRAAGHEVYDFRNPTEGDHGFSWEEISVNWELWTPEEQIVALRHPVARRGLGHDFRAMQWCDAVVMLQPCGRSAALELGWAIGARKKTVVIMAPGTGPELMIGLADHLCLNVTDALSLLEHRPLFVTMVVP